MTRITSASSLANQIRQRWSRQRTEAAPGAIASSGASAVTGCSSTPAVAERHALLSTRVRSISPDDPQRERKAFRMFLELTMLEEFGDAVINDPAFYQLVDSVHEQMCSDPALELSMRAAARALLDGTTPANP
jgi:hypothetical protein